MGIWHGGCWVGIKKDVGMDVSLAVRLGCQLGWVWVEWCGIWGKFRKVALL